MADQVILNKSILTDIGDAIREKEGSTALIPSVDMAARIAALPIDGSFNINGGDNTDAKGHWHKPDDWDDIESIDLTGKHECYFLCGTKLSDYPFFAIRCYGGGTLKWCYGHVSNGVFTIHPNSTEKTFSSGAYLRLFLGNIEDDYVVVRITATSYISSVATAAWASTTDLPYAMGAGNNCILMRYGRLYRGNSLQCQSYYLQSDHMVDFGEYYQNTSTTMSFGSAYSADFSLQKVRWSGTTDFSKLKITSFASMFTNCFMLSDFEDDLLDMTGWVTSSTTRLDYMFNACWSLKAKLIVKDWDMVNVANASYVFYNLRSVKEIEGLETWTAFDKVTTVAGLFYWCCCWQKDCLDISSWKLGGGSVALTNTSLMFHSCYGLKKVILDNMNLSNCTTIGSMFYSSGIQEIEWGNNFIPPSSKCTDFSSVFHYCFALNELKIKGWDFSGVISGKMNNFIYYMYNTRKIECEGCVSNTIADTTSTLFCRYCYNVRYLDASWLDFSKFSASGFYTTGWDSCYQLVDFYPPKNIHKGLKFTYCYNLSHDSLLRIIDNLVTVSSATTLTLGAYNLAKLTDDEKAVATAKGWTLA